MSKSWMSSAMGKSLATVLLLQCFLVLFFAPTEALTQRTLFPPGTQEENGDPETFTKTPYQGRGQYAVSKDTVHVQVLNKTSTLRVYKPEGPADTKWPGIVFGHGLCTSPDAYDELLKDLSSWGYLIVATKNMSDCGARPVGNGITIDTKRFQHELKRNLMYLSEREDVNASQLAIAGHSMGGGTTITAAAKITQSDPDLIKAVIAIAPWNGVKPIPFTVVSEIKAPIMLFCGEEDSLCPCSGPVTMEFGVGLFSLPVALTNIPFFGLRGINWGGGVNKIFENVSNSTPAVLAEVKYANHITVASVHDKKQEMMMDLGNIGMQFTDVDPPVGYVEPTAEYIVAFLKWAMGGDETASELIWGDGILQDNRFVQQVKRQSS